MANDASSISRRCTSVRRRRHIAVSTNSAKISIKPVSPVTISATGPEVMPCAAARAARRTTTQHRSHNDARRGSCANGPEKPMPGNTTQRYKYCLDEEDQEPQRQHDSVRDDVRRQRALGSPGRRQVKVSNGPLQFLSLSCACFAVFRQRTGLPGASSSQCSMCSAVICVAQWVVSTATAWMVQNVLSSLGSSVVRL
jgi:hypothetical protein